VRSRAFIVAFHKEIGPETVAAGVNAHMPADYVEMAGTHEFFVVEDKGSRVGFFTFKRVDRTTAEISLVYVDLDHLGKGIGSRCIGYIEVWIGSTWPEVGTLFLDTIIPKYNGGFYEKMGFEPAGEAVCRFPGCQVRAVRFEKTLPRRDGTRQE
jgi:GNAT superfamily N-acetyltransferase